MVNVLVVVLVVVLLVKKIVHLADRTVRLAVEEDVRVAPAAVVMFALVVVQILV